MSSASIKKELFFDDQEIEAIDNLTRGFHKPTPYSNGPVMSPEYAWEGNGTSASTVIYDSIVKKFRMWYQTYYKCRTAVVADDKQEVALFDEGYKYGVGYAESDDGVHFVRPKLGRVQYEGEDINLAICGYDSPAPATCVLRVDEPNPQKRYRLWVYDAATIPKKHSLIGMSLYVSPDGYDWKGYEWKDEWCNDPQPFCYVKQMGEYRHPYNIGPNETNGIFWDETIGKFVNYCRTSNGSVRCIGRMESSDGINWNKPVLVATPDLDDPLMYHFYMAKPYRSGEFIILYVMTYSPCQDHKCHVEVLASRDGYHFVRVGQRQKWIAAGDAGWHGGMVSATSPILHDDRLWVYVTGSDSGHEVAGRTEIGLYHFRPDGYVSLEADDREGAFTTRKMVWLYDNIHINAQVGAGGSVRVAVLPGERGMRVPKVKVPMSFSDSYPEVVTGFTKDDCIPFNGDSTHAAVEFKESQLASLKGRYVQLRFYLDNARLFSWQVS